MVAVMVALPAATPVTTPLLATVALVVSLEDQVTDALAGTAVAVSFLVPRTATFVRDGETVTEGTSSLAAPTVTLTCSTTDGRDAAFTVSVVVPALMPVILPSASTVAMLASSMPKWHFWFAPEGVTV